ncbi:MAG: hypothetical protein KAG66_07260, partial [Methylococcales bacterium]|nr:hypothetical protein [Methylococcales bacterium]
NQLLAMNGSLTGVEWVDPIVAGAGNFIELGDTPNDFTTGATSGDILRINVAGSALEWFTPSYGVSVLTELLDVPDNFGAPGEVLTVNAASSAAIWVAGGGGNIALSDLTDTPSSLGTAGQVLQVNAGLSAVEWVTPSSGAVTLLSLTDTPAGFGNAGQVLATNAGTNGSEWVDSLNPNNTYIKAGLMGFFSGVLVADSKLIYMVLEEDLIYDNSASQSTIKALVPPTSNLSLDIRKVTSGGADSSIGSINIATGTGLGSVSLTAITIPTGDAIYILAPADTLDCADLFLNLTGKSLLPIY